MRHHAALMTATLSLMLILLSFFLRTLVYDVPGEGETMQAAVADHIEEFPREFVSVLYHERIPYYISTIKGVGGLCGEPASRAFSGAKIPFRWLEMPAARQIELIRADSGRLCGLGWFRTAERESFGRYSLPLYQDRPTVAVIRAETGTGQGEMSVDELLNDRGLTLLVKSGYSYGAFLDTRIRRADPPRVITTGDNSTMLSMIASGRADYFFIAAEEARVILDRPEATNGFRTITFVDMPEGNRRYLLCSASVTEQEIAAVNHFLECVDLQREEPLP